MRTEHRPYAEIATELGITAKVAEADYRRALEALKREQDERAKFAVAQQLAVLDTAQQAVFGVLRHKHVTVSHGKIIAKWTGRYLTDPETGDVLRDDDDRPLREYEDLQDDAPVLQAVDRLIKIEERRARLRGLDAPVKVEVDSGKLAAIRAIAERLAARRLGDVEPGGTGPAAGDAEAPGPGGEAV
jgi:hypothetical protein